MEAQRQLFRYTLLILLLVPTTAGGAGEAAFEKPPTLPAQILAPASPLSADGFHVDKQVPTDGLMAHFTKTSKTQVFADSLETNAARPVQAAGQMLMHPVDTVQELPAGVGRFFGRVGLGAKQVKEAATGQEGATSEKKTAALATRTGQATRDVFGYEQERRGLAKKLHVDPYTTNPVLVKQLDDFALVAFRAHVGVTTTMSIFIPGSMAITATRVVSTWVWDTPKADLIVQNQKSLQELGVPESKINALTRNRTFPLSVQTAFVANPGRLPGVPERVDAVALASTAQSEVQARFLTDAVGMLARYHETQTPIARLLVRKAIIGQDRNGAIVVEAPVDYVSWIEDVSYFAHRPDLQKSRRVISLTGQFSPVAKKNFMALGWVVNEKTNPVPDSNGSL